MLKVIVKKSAVSVGTANKVSDTITKNYNREYDVVRNPEFLRQGVVDDDFIILDRLELSAIWNPLPWLTTLSIMLILESIIRIFITYCPRMRLNDVGALPAFIGYALTSEDMTEFGNGSQTRSFYYLDDLL